MIEEVVLLDEVGHTIGRANKAGVHHQRTPLHLAFSCYVLNSRDEVALTRRATHKRTWPGVWTNTCCGHPAPGEPVAAAVSRRLGEELGIEPSSIDLILPRFRYRATMSDGVTENEMCPVFRAYSDASLVPNPEETDDVRWMDWTRFCDAVIAGTFLVSPWCESQVAQLRALGSVPSEWPVAPDEQLPPAARG